MKINGKEVSDLILRHKGINMAFKKSYPAKFYEMGGMNEYNPCEIEFKDSTEIIQLMDMLKKYASDLNIGLGEYIQRYF